MDTNQIVPDEITSDSVTHVSISKIEESFLEAKNGGPGVLVVFVDEILKTDFSMNFLRNFRINSRIEFLNCLPAALFDNYFANKYIVSQTASQLDPVKIHQWFKSYKKRLIGDHHHLVRRLITMGSICAEDVIQVFINAGLPKKSPTDAVDTVGEWYETLEVLLMYLVEMPEPTIFENCLIPKVNIMLAKYYHNRCKMLELEIKAKEQFNCKNNCTNTDSI
jgi:hypothetical protein